MKLQGLFYQASPALAATDIVGTGAGAPYADNSGVFTTLLGASSNGTNFYVVRQISNKWDPPRSQIDLLIATDG